MFFQSFTRTRPFSTAMSASDMVYAMTGLLQRAPTLGPQGTQSQCHTCATPPPLTSLSHRLQLMPLATAPKKLQRSTTAPTGNHCSSPPWIHSASMSLSAAMLLQCCANTDPFAVLRSKNSELQLTGMRLSMEQQRGVVCATPHRKHIPR